MLWNRVFNRILFGGLRRFFARHYLTLGHNANILTGVEILNSRPDRHFIVIGENSIVNARCLLDGRHKPITIGANVDIGRECAIFTLEHDPHSDDHAVRSGAVDIEDYAWIAARVTILPGVRIGRGAVVGAGSVVTRDVLPAAIVAGNPAVQVGTRRSGLKYNTAFFPHLR